MKYKLIGTDYDGTLLTTDKKVTEYTKKTFIKYKNDGYVNVGVTARSLESVKRVMDLDMFNYLILLNGSYLYDIKNDKIECMAEINRNTIVSLTSYLDSICYQIDYCSSNIYYIYKGNNTSNLSFLKNINSFDDVKEPISKLNIFLNNQSDLLYYRKYINDTYNDLYCGLMTDSDEVGKWLVVVPKNISKMVTLKQLGDELNIDTSQMIFFGDSYNDMDAIKGVGHGVAMLNSIDEVKELTSNVTYKDNNHDGVADYLNKLLGE